MLPAATAATRTNFGDILRRMADISPLCTSLELFLVWCSFLQLPVLYYRKYVVAGGRVAEGAQTARRAK
jgi:hypothetical protein